MMKSADSRNLISRIQYWGIHKLCGWLLDLSHNIIRRQRFDLLIRHIGGIPPTFKRNRFLPVSYSRLPITTQVSDPYMGIRQITDVETKIATCLEFDLIAEHGFTINIHRAACRSISQPINIL